MHARTGIACFGEALIDFLADPPGADDASRRFSRHAGGAPANVAVGVARLGGCARFVGMLGDDMFGRFLFAQLQRRERQDRDGREEQLEGDRALVERFATLFPLPPKFVGPV